LVAVNLTAQHPASKDTSHHPNAHHPNVTSLDHLVMSMSVIVPSSCLRLIA